MPTPTTTPAPGLPDRPKAARPRAGRLVRPLLTAGLVAALAVGLTFGATLAMSGQPNPPPGPGPAPAAAFGQLSSASLTAGIGQLQEHLRAQPRDATGWATLGLSYVEQARLTADPAYYPKAAAALAEALRVQPGDNDAAHAGLAALDAARHDFAAALNQANRSLAINPFGARALAVRIDALVELGRYPAAMAAATHADKIAPGIPVFTRLAYVNELYGRTAEAHRVLELALTSADDPGDLAYVHAQLGGLAWSHGDVAVAGREFAAALRADPGYLAAVEGRARVRAATGDVTGALRDLGAVVTRLPLPGYLTEYGELLTSVGRSDQADRQYAVARTWVTLAKASGVATDLETALFAADHGDKSAALRAARAEWARRHSVHVADALAWALHANGRDVEALTYARRANGLGYRNAMFLYHQGMIEKSLARAADARRDLAAALRMNPHFSALHAPLAKATLTSLGGAS
jgi:tetratricopeptide (TPR) repeat protein